MKLFPYKDFEDYLGYVFAKEENPLDDAFADAFNEWLCDLEPDNWIKYGDQYAKIVSNQQ